MTCESLTIKEIRSLIEKKKIPLPVPAPRTKLALCKLVTDFTETKKQKKKSTTTTTHRKQRTTKSTNTAEPDAAWKKEYGRALGGDLSQFLPHQLVPAWFLTTKKGADGITLVHGTGTGKTRTGIATALACEHLAKREFPGVRVRILVLTQKSLLTSFQKEFEKLEMEHKNWEFMTYEGLANQYNKNKPSVLEKLGEYCVNSKNLKTILLVDEAHHMKGLPSKKPLEEVLTSFAKRDAKGRRTKVLLACAQRAWKRILLTATPIMNRLDELSPLVAAARGNEPLSESEIKEIEAIPVKNKMEEVIGVELPKERKDAIIKWLTKPNCVISYYDGFSSTKKKKNTQKKDFPLRKDVTVHLEMTPHEYEQYAALEEKISRDQIRKRNKRRYAEEGTTKKGVKGEAKREKKKQETGAFYGELRQALNKLKLSKKGKKNLDDNDKDKEELGAAAAWVINHFKTHPKEKALFYSGFIEVGVEAMAKLLDEHNIRYVKITGNESAPKRKQAVEAFNTDPKIQVFLISKAGGEGLDLKGTRSVILWESSWNDKIEEQAIARGERYKSHSHLPVSEQTLTVYRLLVHKPAGAALNDVLPSVDDYLLEISKLKEKSNKLYQKILQRVSIEANEFC